MIVFTSTDKKWQLVFRADEQFLFPQAGRLSVPSPDGAVIADADQSVPSARERGLSDGRGALGVGEHRVVDQRRLGHLQIPDVGPAHLVTQGQHPLMLVQRETDKPNLAVLETDLVDDGHFVLSQLEAFWLRLKTLRLCLILIHEARFPADDCVFTGLREDKISKPFAAINIVPMNVSCAKVRKVTKLRWKHFFSFEGNVGVGEFNGSLK